MKRFFKLLSLLLATVMLLGVVLVACKKNTQGDTSTSTNDEETNSNTAGEPENSDTDKSGETNKTEGPDESDSADESSQGTDSDESKPETTPGNDENSDTEYTEQLDYEGSQNVEYADFIKDKVASGYCDGVRTSAFVENMNMSLIHGLNGNVKNTDITNLVNSISNKSGGVYINNTMDAFVKTADGKVYYASKWVASPYYNILRGGYYYNEVRIAGQGFGDGSAVIKNAVDIDLSTFVSTSTNQVSDMKIDENGILSYTVDNVSADPGIQSSLDLRETGVNVLSKQYNALLITMKTQDAYMAEIFVKTHKMSNYSQAGAKFISVIPGDDFHTYVVRLDDLSAYSGYLTGIRIDMSGLNGEKIEIHSIKAVNINDNAVPVRLDRGFHAYSDKLHQELHFVTTAQTDNVASYGMITEIAADTVDKFMAKDANGIHTSIADVDWSSAQYVGFDIEDVGIFGYILANDPSSGTLSVALEDGKYVITQEKALEKGSVLEDGTNFYMGHRIYTDTNHTFTKFQTEAEIERNPLGSESFTVEFDKMNRAKYVGYDYLRGAYEISLRGTSFNTAYYQIWNRHYRANITVKGDEFNRRLYLYTSSTSSGLECAVVLNKKDLMLPIPLQVIKNFGGDGEESIFLSDKGYSETYMPVVAGKGSEQSFAILNLYQNWGKYPLKQLSWIQFGTPYYHLSTGVTETNCIMPMYGGGPAWQTTNDPAAGIIDEFYMYSGKSLSTLPDFRAMSGILWKDQPQHNSCMDATWLEYYTADGSWVASECFDDRIESYGPIYADITLDYISDDGKIMSSYRHAEMPQTDENRTYYTIRHDIKDSIDIANFMEDFTIFESNSRFGPYDTLGYLNEKNESVIEDADRSGEHRFITLGDEYPYYTYFGYYLAPNSNMCNYAVIIKDWDIVLGGKKYEDNFVIEEWFQNNNLNFTRLTLNLGEITLSEGDYIEIDLILLPWGKANDVADDNVMQVIQDSCVEPYKVEAIVGSVIEDDFIPKIQSVNNTAEFKFSGGHNNGVVRVYGFDILTRPVIEELVDGKWVEYDTTSLTIPDKNQNAHYYDGYSVYYDGDGLYSYAFVIHTDNGAERTFRVSAIEFEGYPKDPSPSIEDPFEEEDSNDSDALVDPDEARPKGDGAPKLYFSAQDLYLAAKDENANVHMLDEYSLRREDGIKFARYLTYGMENQDAYIVLYSDPSKYTSAGKYVAVKYRTKTANASMEFWVNSSDASYNPGQNNTHVGIINDGEWQYAILDLTVATSTWFNGKQLALLRFDFLNSSTAALPQNSYLDIAYIGFFDTEEQAGRFEFGDEYRTKEQIKADNYALCVDPESGYSLSDRVYVNNIDFINGIKPTWTAGNSKEGVSVIEFNSATLSNGYLTFAGWTVVDGGVEKYIWSVDGGKTWYKTGLHIIDSIGSGAGAAHHKVITGKIGSYTFSQGTNRNSTYQVGEGSEGGIAINLSAFNGQTVDVVFAAVPAKDPQAVCPLALVKNVTVIGSSGEAEKDELLPPPAEEDTRTDEEIKADNNAGCIAPESGYSESTLVYGANLDFINAQKTNDQGGNSRFGCSIYTDEYTTIRGTMLVFSGWAVVDGGIQDYVYSIDGGKTWTVIGGTPGDGAGNNHYNVLKGRLGDVTFSEGSNLKSTFQGAANAGENITGLSINLSAHAGKTLEVIFAAIPVKEPNSLCLFAKLTNLKVASAN